LFYLFILFTRPAHSIKHQSVTIANGSLATAGQASYAVSEWVSG